MMLGISTPILACKVVSVAQTLPYKAVRGFKNDHLLVPAMQPQLRLEGSSPRTGRSLL